jgi:hypothetical protein
VRTYEVSYRDGCLKGDGWASIHRTLVDVMWSALAPHYRNFINGGVDGRGGHGHRVKLLMKCQLNSSGYRKFVRATKKEAGASLSSMLTAVLGHPKHLMQVFESLGVLVPHLGSKTTDEKKECMSLADTAALAMRRVTDSTIDTNRLENVLVKIAFHPQLALPCFGLASTVLLVAFPHRFYAMVNAIRELEADTSAEKHDG